MTQVVLPYRTTLAQGQPEKIAEVLADLDELARIINGLLGTDNWSAVAGDALAHTKVASGYLPSKLGQEAATDGQLLTWDNALAKYMPKTLVSGATVATTVAGLGTATNGKIGHIRAGSTPFEFELLVYDSTYAKWVSSAHYSGAGNRGAATLVSTAATAYASVDGTGESGWGICPYKVFTDAGLTIQFNMSSICETDGGSGGAITVATRTFDDGDNTTNDGTTGVTFHTNVEKTGFGTGNPRYRSVGWGAASAFTAKRDLAICLGAKVVGGGYTMYIYSFSIGRRWVG